MEQVYLRCSAGTVEWMYPTGALIVNLRPNTFSPSRHLTLCIKPLRGSSGANIYLEKTGELKLLVRDGDLGPGQVPCFGFEQGGLFVEATPQQDISRRTTGFQYELSSRRAGPDLHALSGECGAQGAGLASGRSSPVCWACPHLLPWGRITLPESGLQTWRGCPRVAKAAPGVLWAVWTQDDGRGSEQSRDTVLAPIHSSPLDQLWLQFEMGAVTVQAPPEFLLTHESVRCFGCRLQPLKHLSSGWELRLIPVPELGCPESWAGPGFPSRFMCGCQ